MSEQQRRWQPYLERVKRDPSDPEAIAALEAYLRAQDAQPTSDTAKRYATTMIARAATQVFLGSQLFGAVQRGWDAWSAHLSGSYQPTGARAWPEPETRDVAAAIANRFLRIGVFGALLALIPALMLLFQSVLMIVQVRQINTQNLMIQEQNQLTREQFGIGYKTQLIAQLYDVPSSCVEPEPADCVPVQLLRIRQEAARGLVQLARISGERPTLSQINLAGAQLTQARFEGVDLSRARLSRANLQGADLTGARFSAAVLDGASLREADLSGANLQNASLQEVNLTGAKLHKADLTGAALRGAIVAGADMTQAVFHRGDRPGRRDREDAAKLSQLAALEDTTLRGANLIRAIFQGASMRGVSFEGARLSQANFQGAQVRASSFKEADLSGANLAGATLEEVDLTGATLREANLQDVRWVKVICPDGSASAKHQDSCAGHLEP